MSNQNDQSRINNNYNEQEEENRRRIIADEDYEGVDAAAAIMTGYCHVCDKQVTINADSFTCRECQGGFIELFENEESQRRPLQQSTNIQQDAQRTRIDSIRFNLTNLLPLLLPQLMNQTLTAVGSASSPQSHQQSPNITISSNMSGMSGTPTIAQRVGPTTRLQFIVPGEQFDLYGVINNVLNDILDPRRMQAGSFSGPLNFQPPPIRMFQLHGDLRDYAWGATGLDTIITQLLNQLENTGPPPATEQQINCLPLVKITQEEYDNNIQCSICMEDFNLNEEAKKLPCKHYFHPQCILEWLKLHGTCPVCRKNLNGEDTSQREYISRPPGNSTSTSQTEENNSGDDSERTTIDQINQSTNGNNPIRNPSTSNNQSSDASRQLNSSSASSTNNQQATNYYDSDDFD